MIPQEFPTPGDVPVIFSSVHSRTPPNSAIFLIDFFKQKLPFHVYSTEDVFDTKFNHS